MKDCNWKRLGNIRLAFKKHYHGNNWKETLGWWKKLVNAGRRYIVRRIL